MDSLVESTGNTPQSFFGTPIYLANTQIQAGTITTYYDTLPLLGLETMCPLGLQHDFYLITGQNLPQMVMRP